MTAWVSRVRALGRACATVSAAIGLLALVGWVAGLPHVRDWGDAVEIRANAALCLALLGLAGRCTGDGRAARLRELTALIALTIGLATMGEHVLGDALGIDGLLARDPSPAAGRMSPYAAAALSVLSLGFLALDLRVRNGVHLSELAGGFAGLVGLLALFDRVYGASLVLPESSPAVALPTAIGLLALAVALVAARPARGAMEAFTSPRLGGELLRRAVVPVLLFAVVQGLATAHGVRQGWLSPASALVVMTLGFMLLVAAILARTAALLDRADLSRAALLADLETRIAQRTAGLTAANQALEQQQADLARARDDALNAARVKSEFLANVTHELRTPIAGAMGLLDAALEAPHDAVQLLRSARATTAEALACVDALLDVTALESGQLALAPAPFELAPLVQAAVEPSRARALRQRLQLSAELQPSVPAHVVGDARRIQQVLASLVSNAVKFTREGVVRVEVTSTLSSSETVSRVRFAVTDTGPGIAPARRAELFRVFHQLDNSPARAHGGAGLGLAIAAQLVEMMEGSIGVVSEVGVGSTFWFEIPLTRAAPRADGGRVRSLAAAIGPAALRRSAQVFLDYLNPLVEQLEAAVRARSSADVQIAAHRLRGSASSFGADSLAAACAEFEKFARANMIGSLPDRLPALQAAATQARLDLERWLDELDPAPVRRASNA